MIPRQRNALYRYALLGGTVVFHGGIPEDAIFKAGAWEALLENSTTKQFRLNGQQLLHVELNEGVDILSSTAKPKDGVPVLNFRDVGTGHVGHTAFLPHGPATPSSLRSDKLFWKRFAAVLPRNRFPFSIADAAYMPLRSNWTSLGFLGVFLGGYSLLVVFAAFFLGRRGKARRQISRWRWIAVPILFSVLVPFLVAMIRSAATDAHYVEYTWFGKHSTQGVVHGTLRLRSAGKQEHQIDFGDKSAFADRRDR